MLKDQFFFNKFRESIARTYTGLFKQQDNVADDETENSFIKFWGWYSCISLLAQDKVWKIDSITDLSLITCLNHLSYINDLNQERNKQIKEID